MSTWGKHANIEAIGSDSDGTESGIFDARMLDLGVPVGKKELGRKAMLLWASMCPLLEGKPVNPSFPGAPGQKRQNVLRLGVAGQEGALVAPQFFVMADDDSFIVTDNLERTLSEQFNASAPLYAGYALTHMATGEFIGGGGGIVLSKGAMRLLCDAIRNPQLKTARCNPRPGGLVVNPTGDVATFDCMRQLGIKATNIPGFHPFPAHEMVEPEPNWCSSTWWIPKKYIRCPPVPDSISFHSLPLTRWREVYYWTHVFQRKPL